MKFSKRRSLFVYATIGSFFVIALVGFCLKDAILIRYHRSRIEQLKSSSSNNIENGLQIVDLDEIAFHRDRLVHLGALFRKRYTFENLPNSRAVRKRFTRSILRSFPNNHFWRLSGSFTDVSEEPLVLEIWDEIDREQEWDRLVELLRRAEED